MKKIILITNILVSLFVISSCSESLDYENVLFEGELTFALVGENEFAITEYNGEDKFLDLPDTYKGKPITKIYSYVFASLSITGVEIGKYVDTIGEGAFASNLLTSVTIPSSVTTIGDKAFANNRLTSVTIPSRVTIIGDAAFYNNQLTSVTIPSSVTIIGDLAFYKNPLVSVLIEGERYRFNNFWEEFGFPLESMPEE